MALTSTRRRRLGIALGTALVVALLVASAGPLLRGSVRRAAERRGVTLEVGTVWPTFSGVRLVASRVQIAGLEGVGVRIDEARLDLGLGLRLQRVVLRGVHIELRGTAHDLWSQWAAWQELRHTEIGPDSGARTSPEIELADGSLVWGDGDVPPRAEADGVAGTRTAQGSAVSIKSFVARLGRSTASLSGLAAKFDAAGSFTGGHAGALTIDVQSKGNPTVPASPQRAESQGAVDVSTPLIDLPDLRIVQDGAQNATALLARHFAAEAAADVEAVTWHISLRDGSVMTVGPGALSLGRGPSFLRLDFAAGATAQGPPFRARVVLPTARDDSTLDVQGGPVSLAALGVQDGNAGLFDVARTAVSGRAHFVVDADARSLTFDSTGAARGVSIRDPRLASDDVRGLDVQLRARGTLSMPGDLRFDDLAATVGALQVESSGVLTQSPDHVSAAFHITVPTTPCNTLLQSIPIALLPMASGMTFSGTFGAEGRVVFDSRSLDDLDLDYQVLDRCRATVVPASLSHDAFARPFTHRVYLPDGSTEDEETGPGTSGWAPLDQISPFMEVAVTTTEDGAFRAHHGFNRSAIRASIIANLKARRFVRGASTLTMQLAKNLFLSREKTLSRKLEEVILTDYLEQIMTKDEILELYFNVVEFGPAVYGITAAADYYFGRSPADLDVAEAFFLASILPSPLRSASVRDSGALSDARTAALRSLMRIARKRGLLTDDQLAEGLRETVEFWHGGDKPAPHVGIPTRSRIDAAGTGGDGDTDPPEPDPAP